MVSSADGWAVGRNGTILRWNGISWFSVPSPTTRNLFDLFMVSSTEGWAVGESGTIIRWNGTSWENVSPPVTENLFDIYMISPTDGWIVGLNGTNLRWDGAAWAPRTPIAANLFAVYMLSSTEGWVGGDGNILKWDGLSFSVASSLGAGAKRILSISMASSNVGYAVGLELASGTGVLYRWDGISWKELTPPVEEPLGAVWMVSPEDGWIVGGRGTILRFTPLGTQISTPMLILILVGIVIVCVVISTVIHFRKRIVTEGGLSTYPE
jgi:photosystem II stability/assembly factor-like uncharacterized protein